MEHESIQRVRTGGSKGSMGSGNGPSPTLTNTNSMGMVDGTSAGVAYEIHFPAPLGLGREAVMKHHLTTRNVFAVLFGKSLVGVTLGETLEDLVERLDQYIPSGNYLAQASKQRLGQSQPQQQMAINLANVDLGDGNKKKKKKRNTIIEADCVRGNVARVLEYLLQREFDDFRNCPDVAAGMLCFAEKHQLGELWREAFCHCVGMLSRLEGAKDYLVSFILCSPVK